LRIWGQTVDEFQDLARVEEILKLLLARLDRLKQAKESPQLQASVIRYIIRYLVEETRVKIEHLLMSNKKEISPLKYKLRLKFPVISHLKQILNHSPESQIRT
jgi:hypothetical protein